MSAPDPIRFVVCRNPFDRSQRDERLVEFDEPPTIAALVGEYIPAGVDIAASVNGQIIPVDEWKRPLLPRDQLVVVPRLHGGGGGGILGAALSVALMVAAPYMAAAIAGQAMTLAGISAATASMGLIGFTALTMGVSLVGSALISAVVGSPDKPTLGGVQSFDNSQAYSWNPATTQQPGGPIVRAYGTNKLFGNVIAGSITESGENGRDQVAHMLIDLGLGPYSDIRSIKINDQPIDSYSGVSVTRRLGNLNQDIIAEFDDTSTTHSVGAKVVKDSPVVRSAVSDQIDALDVVLTFPYGLYHSNDSGGLDKQKVRISIELSADGGSTWSFIGGDVTDEKFTTSTVSGRWSKGHNTYSWGGSWVELEEGSSVKTDHSDGEWAGSVSANLSDNEGGWYVGEVQCYWKWVETTTTVTTTASAVFVFDAATTKPIRRTIRIPKLTRGTSYKVRVKNWDADQTDSRYQDDCYWVELNEVVYDDFTYPRTVLVGINALATDQISGGLSFSCIADGALIRVWNGSSWSVEFNRNPAWVTFDILTQPVFDNSLNVVRYDGWNPSRLILADFYAWAQWCDEQVSNGAGGTEARCTFDGIYDTQTDMWSAALECAKTARATLVLRGTSVGVVYDHAQTTPAQIFTVGNTRVSSFRETFLPMDDRAKTVEVDYINADDDYTRDKLTVGSASDPDSTRKVSVALKGVTRTSQAWREGEYRRACNQYIQRTAEIGVDIDSIACTVGDLVWVQSNVPQWGVGGRIVSGTTTQLTLDTPVTIVGGKSYEVRIRLDDDTVCTRTVTTGAGTTSVIDLASALPDTPSAYCPWAFGESSKSVKEFIVTDTARSGDQNATLSLIEYNASVHSLDYGLSATPIANVTTSTLEASGMSVDEVFEVASDGTYRAHLMLSWAISGGASARVSVMKSGGVPIISGVQTSQLSIRVPDVIVGETYYATVTPVAINGFVGGTRATIAHTVAGPAIPKVVSITSSETLVVAAGAVVPKITVRWSVDIGQDSARFRWRYNGGAWVGEVQVAENFFDIILPDDGIVEAEITPRKNVAGLTASFTKSVAKKSEPPADVQNFAIASVNGSTALLTYDPSAELDVQIGGYLWLRFTPKVAGVKWGDASDLTFAPGNSAHIQVPALDGTYLAKWVDSSGHPSANYVSITTNIGAINSVNNILGGEQSPWASGSLSNMSIDGSNIELSSAALVDDAAAIDSMTMWDTLGGSVRESGYYRTAYFDMGNVYTARASAYASFTAFDINDMIDARTALIDDWQDINSALLEDVNAVPYIRITQDDPAGAPTWTDWTPLMVASDLRCRAIQFELRATTYRGDRNLSISSFVTTIDVPDRSEQEADLVSGAGTRSVTYSRSFFVTPAVGIAAQGMATGDYYTLANKTSTGFDITFKNSLGTPVSRTFDYVARGY